MSITGFNNLSMTDVLNPSLTTVALGQELFGQLAGERLLARIRGEVDGPGEAVALPFSIVARASTAPPPGASDDAKRMNSAGNAA